MNYGDRDRILAAAWNKPDLRYENSKILLFPDYSLEIQQRLRSFMEIRRLREKGIKFSLLYPSWLRIVDGDHARFFDSPDAVSTWLEDLPFLSHRLLATF